MKFRKKPVVVEAIQFNGNFGEINSFVGEFLEGELTAKGFPTGVFIPTREGMMKAFLGDWIIKEPFATDDRKFYPCKPDIFEQTYEPVN